VVIHLGVVTIPHRKTWHVNLINFHVTEYYTKLRVWKDNLEHFKQRKIEIMKFMISVYGGIILKCTLRKRM
jgi:hypothetical protein